jgi:threonyl-tRNA synthetase
VVATIVSEADPYAEEVVRALREAGLRVDLDARNEKIGYKVREHSLKKVPLILAVGRKEAETCSVALRRFGSEGQVILSLDAALEQLGREALAPDLARSAAPLEQAKEALSA